MYIIPRVVPWRGGGGCRCLIVKEDPVRKRRLWVI